MIGGSLEYTHGKVLGSDEGIKLGSNDGNVIGYILGHTDGITLGINVLTYMGSLDGSFGNINWILWCPKPR